MSEERKDIMRESTIPLSEEDKLDISTVKRLGNDLYNFLDLVGECREISLAKTKLEEAVMWAVKGITE